MKRIVLTFGLLSGVIGAGLMFINMTLVDKGVIDFDRAEITGYTAIVLSFVLVFFGIRSYRENIGGGVISFGRAFGVGILITLISSLIYVLAWEILYFQFNFAPDFLDTYAAHAIEKMRAQGATEAAIALKSKQLADFKVMYANPLINAAMTLMEPLPVGLILTLVSAAILRKKKPLASV
jgi:hypothetical protein